MAPPSTSFVVLAGDKEQERVSVVQRSVGSGSTTFAILTSDIGGRGEFVLRQSKSAVQDADIKKEAEIMERLQGGSHDPPEDWPLAWMDGKLYGKEGEEAVSYWRHYGLGDLSKIMATCEQSRTPIPSAFGAEYLVTMLRAIDMLLLSPNAPRIEHGDIIAENIFLERAAFDGAHPQQLGAIPRFVLGDFDKSQYVTGEMAWKWAVLGDVWNVLEIWKNMHQHSTSMELNEEDRVSWESIHEDVDLLKSELTDQMESTTSRLNYLIDLLTSELNGQIEPNDRSVLPFPGPRLRGALETFRAHRVAAPMTGDSLNGFLELVGGLESPPTSPEKTYASRAAATRAARSTNLRPPIFCRTALLKPDGRFVWIQDVDV
ncbi:hypothetical protein RB597_009149 [Gaeumannomyces tritici]